MLEHQLPDSKYIPGFWNCINPIYEPKNNLFNRIQILPYIEVYKNFFRESEILELLSIMNQSPNYENVSVQGRKDVPDDRISSKRTTIWSTKLAKLFEEKQWPTIELECDDYFPSDWWQTKIHRNWKFIAVSPLFRFMKYHINGEHYAHYDAGFIYPNENFRTLYSFVIYLTTNKTGATRFIEDKQSHEKIWNRTHLDWIRPVQNSEILKEVYPEEGSILIFPHRMCHDVQQFLNEERIIIRGDLIFQAN